MAERRFNTITGADWKRELRAARSTPNSISLQIKEAIAKMNTYRIRYTRKDSDKEQVADRQGSTPISALNFLHKELQIAKNIKPEDYEIKQVSLFYNSDAWGRGGYPMIESPYDIPKSPNPDLKAKQPSANAETSTMPFYNEAASTKPDSGV